MVNIKFVCSSGDDCSLPQCMPGPRARIDKSKRPGSVVITGNTTDRRGSALGNLLGQVCIYSMLQFAIVSHINISYRIGIIMHARHLENHGRTYYNTSTLAFMETTDKN
jgi:hypothetical protein